MSDNTQTSSPDAAAQLVNGLKTLTKVDDSLPASIRAVVEPLAVEVAREILNSPNGQRVLGIVQKAARAKAALTGIFD